MNKLANTKPNKFIKKLKKLEEMLTYTENKKDLDINRAINLIMKKERLNNGQANTKVNTSIIKGVEIKKIYVDDIKLYYQVQDNFLYKNIHIIKNTFLNTLYIKFSF